MASSSKPKQFGLIISKKSSNSTKLVKSSIFEAENDDVIEDTKKSAKTGVQMQETRVKSHIQAQIEKALLEDPTVFEYDAVFDRLEQEKSEKSIKQKENDEKREPKYIKQLLNAAEKRQYEFDAREERKQIKERENEQGEFGDKETFVTSAYRKKMEELEKYKQEEKKREYLESVMDVTRQKDISGFYKHYLNDLTDTKPPKIKSEPTEDQSEQVDRVSTKEIIKKPSGKTYRSRAVDDNDSSTDEDSSTSVEKSPDLSGVKEQEKSAPIRDSPQAPVIKNDHLAEPIPTRKVLSEKEEQQMLIERRLAALHQILAKKTQPEEVEAYKIRYLQRKAVNSH